MVQNTAQIASLSGLLYFRKIAKIAAEKIENIEYNDDPVPSWFNYSDLMLLQEVNSEDSSG